MQFLTVIHVETLGIFLFSNSSLLPTVVREHALNNFDPF